MRQLRSCGFLIVRGRPIESFLLLTRPTRYDLPKGHVDPGESDIECALRELEEETAITVDDIEVDPRFRFTASYLVQSKKFDLETCHKSLVIFLGRLRRDVRIQLTEHTGYQWHRWEPPHRIQAETIDPLLARVAEQVEGA